MESICVRPDAWRSCCGGGVAYEAATVATRKAPGMAGHQQRSSCDDSEQQGGGALSRAASD